MKAGPLVSCVPHMERTVCLASTATSKPAILRNETPKICVDGTKQEEHFSPRQDRTEVIGALPMLLRESKSERSAIKDLPNLNSLPGLLPIC